MTILATSGATLAKGEVAEPESVPERSVPRLQMLPLLVSSFLEPSSTERYSAAAV